ncbi:MAG TPA: SLOG family protein [Rhodanobacteraceae bacterium]
MHVLPQLAAHASIARFLAYARARPEQMFEVTRVGCGLAGYRDTDILPAFSGAPSNCVLPYTWRRLLDSRLPAHVIVAGSRAFNDFDFLHHALQHLLARLPVVTIVSGAARGADQLGERYARQCGIDLIRVPADWNAYGKAVGMLRNQRMSWSASHLVAFWDSTSPGTRNMIDTATRDGLAVRVVRIRSALQSLIPTPVNS